MTPTKPKTESHKPFVLLISRAKVGEFCNKMMTKSSLFCEISDCGPSLSTRVNDFSVHFSPTALLYFIYFCNFALHIFLNLYFYDF